MSDANDRSESDPGPGLPSDPGPGVPSGTGLLLFALDGKSAPAEMTEALLSLADLPSKVELGELLFPCLEPLPADQLDNRIARLCRRNELAPDTVGPGIKAAVFLIRSAASLNVTAEAVAQDLKALDLADLGDTLVPVYVESFPKLRNELVRRAIAGHGKVLAGVDWRIDTLGSSMQGRGFDTPVAMVTFHYQDGGQQDQLTLQMLPEMVGSLRDICDQLLNR